MTQVAKPLVTIENRGHPGLTAGFWGCVLAVLGIVSLGALSVPIAIVCTLVGLVRGILARDAISIGTSLLATCLCVVGFASSPMLLAITVLLATNTPSQNTPPVPPSQQQSQQTEEAPPPGAPHR
jgi:tetrahydromethanopterin S-methyltransferase subunit C